MFEYFIKLKTNGFNLSKILDIGANIGEFSRKMKDIFTDSDIFMIEANKYCEPMLKSTGFNYLISALSDEEKEVSLFLNRKNIICTGTSLYKEKSYHYDDSIEEKVLTRKLSDIFNHGFDLIKIDTQGSELDIIKGGIDVIKKTKYLLIETSLVEYNIGSPLETDVIEYLESIGFTKECIISNNRANNEIIQNDILFKNNNLIP